MRRNEDKEFKITKVTYVDDAEATNRWFELYVKLLRNALEEDFSKNLDADA